MNRGFRKVRLGMKGGSRQFLWAFVLLASSGCVGSRAFRDAREEETLRHWDLAVLKYSRAAALDPSSSKFRIALERAKIKASQFHFEKGKLYRASGRADLAVVELEQAALLDPTNQYAETELRKAQDQVARTAAERSGETRVEMAKRKTRGVRARAPMLEPTSDRPINLNFPQARPVKQIYQSLASAAGINVIFDQQLKDDNVSIVLTNMRFQDALETLMRQENHFYKVIDEKTMLIAADTPQNRKTYEDLVIRTFFLSNGDVTEVSNSLRSLLQTTRISVNKAENSITLRDTADKVAIAERIVEQNDKQLAEVVVDVELLQVNTTKAQDLGLLLSPYSVGASAPAPGGTTSLGAKIPPSSATAAGAFTWDQLRELSIRSFGFTIPAVTYNLIKNNTDAELLAKPELRISEGQKAQLVIGDRVPIPVTSFNTSTVAGTNIVPITSYQYQDVGIKIEVEPRVHHNKEITLKLTVEVSNLNGTAPGTTQPIIGTRTISSNIRLKDGETNFLAGLFRNDKSRTTSKVPYVGDIPILGRLFSDRSTSDTTTDLVLTLTPHIIRIPDITEEDLAPLYVGTDANITYQGTTRVEGAGGAGPFEGNRREPPAPRPPPAGAPSVLVPQNLAPSSPPNDPFRRPPEPVPPQPTPPPVTPRGASAEVSPQTGLLFDFDPPQLSLGPGQQGSVVVRASGNEALAATALVIRFDPSVVMAVSVRPILSDQGVADVHIEAGRVVVETPGTDGVSGTHAVVEITLQGVARGRSRLSLERPGTEGAVSLSEAVVEVR
jgi:general secretion pathway protein D